MKKFVTSLIIFSVFFSCRGEPPKIIYQEGLTLKGLSIPVDSIGVVNKGVLIIRDTVDLNGRSCTLPEGVLVDLTKGQIRNGELVGNNNKLKCEKNAFHRVRINGEWNVPIIKSSFFSDISYDNALCDIFALSNAKVKNKILIEEGEYQVTISGPWKSCITLNSNSELILNGIIRLTPNNYEGYNIINVKGDRTIIKGSGCIIGDRSIHIGKDGEWGMGVNINKCKNISISGISVESCWGDCIYVGNAEHVRIENCTLKNSRRQGISITAANNVKIKKCRISGIKGTAPEYAIDIEPHKKDTCRDISIEQVYITDCKGGVLSWGGAQGASVVNVRVINCTLENIHKMPFRFDDVNNVTVKKCKVASSGKRDPFTLINVRNFKKKDVIIK